MKYRIKNQEVEKAVRGLFKPQEEFDRELNWQCEKHFKYHPDFGYVKFEVNSIKSITEYSCDIYIKASDIEEVVEYDPKLWNKCSKVTPPKIGIYRVRFSRDDEDIKTLCLWNGTTWRDQYDVFDVPEEVIQVAAFKPWDDEESKNDNVQIE